jgi:hypothetical protein
MTSTLTHFLKNPQFSFLMLVFLAAGYSCSVEESNQFAYPNNREPLLQSAYVKLPVGAVKPKGWLYDQLRVQANGFTGNLPDVWDVMHTSGWKGDTVEWEATASHQFTEVIKTTTYSGSTQVNMYPECCYPRFVPRWLEGLVPLAYELDDPELKKLAASYLDFILSVEKPETLTPSITAWSHLGRVLPVYYEATGDKRAVELCGRMLTYFDIVRGNNLTPPPEAVQQTRLGMPLSFAWWYFNQSGDSTVFEKIDWISKNCVDYYRDFFTSPRTPVQHIVDVCQAVQYPVQYYLKSKDPSYTEAVYAAIEKLDRLHGQVGGRWNGDEYTSGLSPTQGSELCSVTELIYSMLKNFEAIGDPAFAERVEKLVFNAVPGTCTPDGWSHQYDQQANQVLVSVDKRNWIGNDNTANIFGFTPHYPCCLSNMHSPFPNYVQYLWMAAPGNGLIAVGYGPSEVTARVGNGTSITITEETNYPFSDNIKLIIKPEKPVEFPLHLRIPSWATETEIVLNGRSLKSSPDAGSIYKLNQEWETGDILEVKFNARVRTETRMNNALAVAWGPLYFSLRIGQSFSKINIREDRRVYPDKPVGVVNWRIDPSTPWNYALAVDPGNPEYEMITGSISKLPFARKDEPVWLPGATDFVPWQEDAPVILKMKAMLVPEWTMNGASADTVPQSPLHLNGEMTTIELIPYGSTRLRISEFPYVDLKTK